MAQDDDALAAQREFDQLNADALAAYRAMEARIDATETHEEAWALMQEQAAIDHAFQQRRGPLLDRIFANRPTPVVHDGIFIPHQLPRLEGGEAVVCRCVDCLQEASRS